MSQRRFNFSPEIQRSFTYEKLSEFTLPGALVLLEGGVVGVIAAKVYDVEPFTLALISAAPMFANLSSLLWSKLASGRQFCGHFGVKWIENTLYYYLSTPFLH